MGLGNVSLMYRFAVRQQNNERVLFSWLQHLWNARSPSQQWWSIGNVDTIGTNLPLWNDILVVTSFEANQYTYIDGCQATHQIGMGHGSHIMHSTKFPSLINCNDGGTKLG